MRFLTIILFLIVTATLAACGGGQDSGNEARIARGTIQGHPDVKKALKHADAKSVYKTANNYLRSGNPKRALQVFANLLSRYPFSEYAIPAELKSVSAYYQSREYQTAIAAGDRFIKKHPRNPHIDYVYYLRGLSNYERVVNKESFGSVFSGSSYHHDPTHLRQAFTDFNLLIQNYPDSIYDKDAQLRMIDIRNRLARYDLNIAEYYMSRRAWVSAIRRTQYLINHYQGADSVPRALEVLETCFRKLGLEDMAQNAQVTLQASYPNYELNRTEFYRQRAGKDPAYKLPPLAGEIQSGRITPKTGAAAKAPSNDG